MTEQVPDRPPERDDRTLMQQANPRQKPVRQQAVLTVRSVQELGPQLVRIVAGGPGFAQYNDKEATDKYVKLLFADPKYDLVPPYDMERLRAEEPEKLPVRRTYTVRAVDTEAQELTLDFVTHGDAGGVAAPWAKQAQPGDTIVLTGAGGAYQPEPETAFHVLAGDLATVPAIAASLEAMDRAAQGVVFVMTDTAEDELSELTDAAPAGVTVTWLRPDGENALLDQLKRVQWPADLSGVQAFVHGEREQMKQIRRYLFNDLGLERSQLSLSAYWAAGRVEDEFQAEKKTPIGKIFDD
ncbi:siderophore-interacting protein [Micrococcoides hystricis]|uniref:Siderophore-interacting protein n=1 Tax=Micrococcoides hystricis TaxID=1572761 RepID=A0ABV6PB82_9MICC